ncbi:FxsA family protein [Microbulbifer sp. S227A]|uniref:FxsA family protein n=1 Tax=Microbulbifer sp. S227A TaxID=3415131 RepID=UPI003C7E9920
MYLFMAFLLVPLIEIGLFIQVGGLIGLWPTLAIVVLTAILGTSLVRSQGRVAMGELRSSFAELNDPTEPLAHGAMILVSGVLLLTPGFFTDALGFALLMPPVRRAVYRHVRARVQVHQFQMGPDMGPGRAQPRHTAPGDVIDGEYQDVTPNARPRSGPSGWVEDGK